MAKKQKERSELEHLRGENKELRKQLRECQKRAKYHEKRSHLYDEDDELPVLPEQKSITCENCGKGKILEHDLKYIILQACTICEYRKRRKK